MSGLVEKDPAIWWGPFRMRWGDGQGVRTFQDENGAAWFVLSDVCAVLELTAPHMVAKRIDQADRNTISVWSAANNRNYDTTVVNESGLYDVVLDSRKPQARTFRRWITSEVVPALRATGQYTVPGHPATQPAPAPAVDPEALAVAVSAAVSQVLEPMSRVASALEDLISRVTRLEHGAEVAAGVREAGS